MSVARRLPANTDELPEGSTNLYHTTARAISAVEGEATLSLTGTTTVGSNVSLSGSGTSYVSAVSGSFGVGVTSPNAALQVDNSVVGATYAFRMQCDPGFTTPAIQVDDVDNNTGDGPYIFVGQNSDATTPAPGALLLKQSDGNVSTIWPDDSNNLRINQLGGAGVNSTEKSSGTVIGTQTSSKAFKDLLGRVDSDEPVHALQRIVRTATSAIHNFTYKNGSFGGQLFRGIVIEDAPWYGMDKDKEHPVGKSLNEIDLFADLTMSVAKLYQQLAIQGDELAKLRKRVEELENA